MQQRGRRRAQEVPLCLAASWIHVGLLCVSDQESAFAQRTSTNPDREYTVADWKKWNVGGTWEQETDAYQMWSPNTDRVGWDYVCAWDGDCENEGAEWWGPSRTEGGPAQYPFGDDKWQ